MTTAPDYLNRPGATLVMEGPHCRILYQDQNTLFVHIEPEVLRARFNEAMAVAVAHYSANVRRSDVAIEPRQIEDVAYRVVLHTLYIYNMWRHTYPDHKDHPLRITSEDLQHPQAHDQCWFYCENVFGAGYRVRAAALIGMTPEEFDHYEQGRRAFFDR